MLSPKNFFPRYKRYYIFHQLEDDHFSHFNLSEIGMHLKIDGLLKLFGSIFLMAYKIVVNLTTDVVLDLMTHDDQKK